jgi:hypothetical protein
MLAVLTFMLGGVISMTLVWAAATDPAQHLDPPSVTRGGGVAYKNDVKEVSQGIKDALLDEHRSTRRMLMGMRLTCSREKLTNEFACRVSYLPEPE